MYFTIDRQNLKAHLLRFVSCLPMAPKCMNGHTNTRELRLVLSLFSAAHFVLHTYKRHECLTSSPNIVKKSKTNKVKEMYLCCKSGCVIISLSIKSYHFCGHICIFWSLGRFGSAWATKKRAQTGEGSSSLNPNRTAKPFTNRFDRSVQAWAELMPPP